MAFLIAKKGKFVWSKKTGNGFTTVTPPPPPNELCFTAEQAGSTVELTVVGSPSIANTEYSINGTNWSTYIPFTTRAITLTNVGDKVYFRNDINGDFSSSIYLQFVMSGKIAASGNVNSMYIHKGFESLSTLSYKYCYCNMFKNCSSLTTAPELPATTLSDYCYTSMFYSCSSLITSSELPATTLADGCYSQMFVYSGLRNVPELPATILANYCYSGMFQGCTSLTTAPELPATTLANNCYASMFYNCIYLTIAPELPATTLANNCYYNMFNGCRGLTTAPELPATTLSEGCYRYMFQGCTSLTTAPELPATTLANSCYTGMFNGCTSLVTAPELPATTSTNYCYYEMFKGCTSLTSVKTAITSWNTKHTADWLSGAAASGTVHCPTNSTIPTNSTSGIPLNWTRELWPVPPPNELCFTAEQANSTVELIKLGSPSIENTAYSRDGKTWTTFEPSTTAGTNVITLTNVGDKVYFRNDIKWSFDYNKCLKFVMSGQIAASGNINSMHYSQNYAEQSSLYRDNCYRNMFDGCTALTTAPELPATTLSEGCYIYMFKGCTSLTTAPELPATTLANSCYTGMFQDCTSLIDGPELPATTLANESYKQMFYGCKKLTSVKTAVTSWDSFSTYKWLYNVAAYGKVYCPYNGIPTGDTSGIPSGWSRVQWTPKV